MKVASLPGYSDVVLPHEYHPHPLISELNTSPTLCLSGPEGPADRKGGTCDLY